MIMCEETCGKYDDAGCFPEINGRRLQPPADATLPERRLGMFNPTPFAAASIGQVHTAALGDDKTIAIKVQFPGVKESIQSDLDQMLTMMGVTMKKDSRGFHQNKDVNLLPRKSLLQAKTT